MLGDEVRRQVGEDAFELVGALGRVVGRAGPLGDLLQRLVVDAAPEPTATATAAPDPPPPNPLPGSLPRNAVAQFRSSWPPSAVPKPIV